MLPKKLAEHDIMHIDNLPVTYFILEKSAPTCVFPEVPQLGSIPGNDGRGLVGNP